MRFRAVVTAAVITALGVSVVGGAVTSEVATAFTYKKCGSFRFKGKHVLFAHRYPCAKAKRKAKYVLRHRHSPPHWTCSLAELSSGFAACHRGRRAWEFVPR
jgi:hypothetical protein